MDINLSIFVENEYLGRFKVHQVPHLSETIHLGDFTYKVVEVLWPFSESGPYIGANQHAAITVELIP